MQIASDLELLTPSQIIRCHANVSDSLPDNLQEAKTGMNIGYKVEPDEDDTYFFLRLQTKFMHMAHIDGEKPFATISHESACRLRIEKHEKLSQKEFIDFATQVGLGVLVSAARAQIQALAAMFEWPVRVNFPLIDVRALMDSRAQAEEESADKS